MTRGAISVGGLRRKSFSRGAVKARAAPARGQSFDLDEKVSGK
ncbi:hypothetical protein [Aquamicrobium sp. LC103]|nr:hypothetical protein [Aquamicrobium sp. LC103]